MTIWYQKFWSKLQELTSFVTAEGEEDPATIGIWEEKAFHRIVGLKTVSGQSTFGERMGWPEDEHDKNFRTLGSKNYEKAYRIPRSVLVDVLGELSWRASLFIWGTAAFDRLLVSTGSLLGILVLEDKQSILGQYLPQILRPGSMPIIAIK